MSAASVEIAQQESLAIIAALRKGHEELIRESIQKNPKHAMFFVDPAAAPQPPRTSETHERYPVHSVDPSTRASPMKPKAGSTPFTLASLDNSTTTNPWESENRAAYEGPSAVAAGVAAAAVAGFKSQAAVKQPPFFAWTRLEEGMARLREIVGDAPVESGAAKEVPAGAEDPNTASEEAKGEAPTLVTADTDTYTYTEPTAPTTTTTTATPPATTTTATDDEAAVTPTLTPAVAPAKDGNSININSNSSNININSSSNSSSSGAAAAAAPMGLYPNQGSAEWKSEYAALYPSTGLARHEAPTGPAGSRAPETQSYPKFYAWGSETNKQATTDEEMKAAICEIARDSEYRAQFVSFEAATRPSLAKQSKGQSLEGILHHPSAGSHTSEYSDKFVSFSAAPAPAAAPGTTTTTPAATASSSVGTHAAPIVADAATETAPEPAFAPAPTPAPAPAPVTASVTVPAPASETDPALSMHRTLSDVMTHQNAAQLFGSNINTNKKANKANAANKAGTSNETDKDDTNDKDTRQATPSHFHQSEYSVRFSWPSSVPKEGNLPIKSNELIGGTMQTTHQPASQSVDTHAPETVTVSSIISAAQRQRQQQTQSQTQQTQKKFLSESRQNYAWPAQSSMMMANASASKWQQSSAERADLWVMGHKGTLARPTAAGAAGAGAGAAQSESRASAERVLTEGKTGETAAAAAAGRPTIVSIPPPPSSAPTATTAPPEASSAVLDAFAAKFESSGAGAGAGAGTAGAVVMPPPAPLEHPVPPSRRIPSLREDPVNAVITHRHTPKDYSELPARFPRSNPQHVFVSKERDLMPMEPPLDPVLAYPRYPALTDRQSQRWSTESRASFVFRGKGGKK